MIKNLKIRTKLIVLSFVSLAIALFLGITSIFKLENTNEGLKRVYHDRVLPLVQLKNIAEAYAVNIVDTAVKLRNDKISFEKCVSNINEAKTIIDKLGKKDNPLNREFEAYSDVLYEVLIDANGIRRFSIYDGKVRWMGVKND